MSCASQCLGATAWSKSPQNEVGLPSGDSGQTVARYHRDAQYTSLTSLCALGPCSNQLGFACRPMSWYDWVYSFLESGTTYEETERWIHKYQLIHKPNSSGWYPIHCAARGTAESVQCLLDHGAQTDVCTAIGWRPIHIATMHGKLDIVKLLLGHPGVSVNSRTHYLMTPLMNACEHSKVELV
jgi:hypothetical protein